MLKSANLTEPNDCFQQKKLNNDLSSNKHAGQI